MMPLSVKPSFILVVAFLASIWMTMAEQQHQQQQEQEQEQPQQEVEQQGSSQRLTQGRKLEFYAGHLQSGADTQGSSFASAGIVDTSTQTLHVVGTTYGKLWGDSIVAGGGSSVSLPSSGTSDPACFYAVANLPGGDNDLEMTWIHSELLGAPAVEEGCLDLFLDRTAKRAIIIGHSDVRNPVTQQVDGLLGTFFDAGSILSENLLKAGMILDYVFDNDRGPSAEQPLQLHGGRLVEQDNVNYPVAITGVPGSNVIFVASMVSHSTTPNVEWQDGTQLDHSRYFRFGKDFDMVITKYTTTSTTTGVQGTLQKSVSEVRSGIFATNEPGDTVQVTALLELPDRLIVAGYTGGWGDGFSPNDSVELLEPVDAIDGFVTQLHSNNLTTFTGVPGGTNPTYRATSGRNSRVNGVCYSNQTPDYIYVTGSTTGRISNPTNISQDDPNSQRGFVMKLTINTMNMVWVKEFDAVPNVAGTPYKAEAISCVVTNDGNNLFVVGNVLLGGGMIQPQNDSIEAQSSGGTDVWIAQVGITGDIGDVVFVKQAGSTGDDTVAHRGGVQVDISGNAVLIGNTNGSMYRKRLTTEVNSYNVFVTMFELDSGEFMLPMDHPEFKSLPPTVPKPITPVVPAPSPTPPATTPGLPAPTVPPPTTPNTTVIPPTNSTGNDSKFSSSLVGFGSWIFRLLILLLGIVTVVGLIVYWNCYHVPKRDVATDRSKVLDYLHDFDVEDVELKHSATGGWHCSYVNDLAQGINRQSDSDLPGDGGLYSPFSGGQSYDPLTAGGGGSSSGSGGGTTRFYQHRNSARGGSRVPKRSSSFDEIEMQDYNNGDENNADDMFVTFGTARESRRERRSNYGGLLSSLGRDSNSRRSRRTSASLSGGSVGSGSSSSRRIHRAKERWENREVI